jgi:PAS domain S-box-containing protein
MNWHYTPYVLPLVAAAVITIALMLIAMRRQAPGATAFAWLMAAVTEWLICQVLEVGGADLATVVFWNSLKYLGIALLPVAWLAFAMQYSGLGQRLTRGNLALMVLVPLLTQAAIWTNDTFHLFRTGIRLTATEPFLSFQAKFATWFWIHTAYSYLLIAVGLVLLMRALIRAPRIYRGQAATLLIGALVPLIGNVVYIFAFEQALPLDPTPFGFVVTGLAFAWGLFRFRLLDVVPAARNAVIESMRDGVLVLNTHNLIVDLNPAAQRMINRTTTQVVGQSIELVLANRADLLERFRDVAEAQAEIVVETDNVPRYYDMRLSPLYDPHQQRTGRLVVLHDITERKRAELAQERWGMQLQVLPEVARSVAAMRDLDELLDRLVNLVRDRLGLYHVGIWLMDEQGESAALKAAAGEAAHQMLQRGYRARAGEVSLVGTALGSGQFHTRGADSVQAQNPLLPEARSEIALPIMVGQRVIGALDVHSVQAGEFDEVATVVLQTVADQLAVAVENVRLLREMQNTVREMETVSGRYTQEAWRNLSQSAGRPYGYRYRDRRIEPATEPEPEARQAWQKGQTVAAAVQLETGDAPSVKSALAIPIHVRDQVVGALSLRLPEQSISDETITLVQEVANRLALTVESARLYQDSQRRAAQERLVSEVTARMRESLDMETVLKTATERIWQSLGVSKVTVRLAPMEKQ